MNKMNKMNKRSGFSLMELIIVIVIIGILISAVVGLNGQKETAKISAAEQIIIQLSNGSQSWAVMNASESYDVKSGSTGHKKISLQELIDKGILPKGFDMEKANPWAGDISIDPGVTKNHFKIELTNVPQTSCVALQHKFSNKAFYVPECGTVTGTKDGTINPAPDPKTTEKFLITF